MKSLDMLHIESPRLCTKMYACLFTFFMYSHHPVELIIDFQNIIFPNVSWQGNIVRIWGVRTPVKRLSLITDAPGSRKNPALSLTFLPLCIDAAASGRWGGRNGFLQGHVPRGCLMTRSPKWSLLVWVSEWPGVVCVKHVFRPKKLWFCTLGIGPSLDFYQAVWSGSDGSGYIIKTWE